MTVLEAVEDTLKALAMDPDVPMNAVYYGACTAKEMTRWNYMVFNRRDRSKSSNKVDYQTTYELHIIHEDYIPEGYIDKAISTLENCAGAKLKATSDPIQYEYTTKGSSDVVIEIATITFYHPEKRR